MRNALTNAAKFLAAAVTTAVVIAIYAIVLSRGSLL